MTQEQFNALVGAVLADLVSGTVGVPVVHLGSQIASGMWAMEFVQNTVWAIIHRKGIKLAKQ